MKATNVFYSLMVSAATLLALETQASAAMYMYQDTTFTNSDWVASKWAGPGFATFTAGQQTIGGSTNAPNTPDYRRIRHTFGPGLILVEHRNVNFNWTPQTNEMATDVDFQYDLRHFTGPQLGAVGFGLNIYQAGKIYRSTPFDNIFADAWTPFNHALVPLSSFSEVQPGTGTTNPFSNPVSNLPMSFGFMSANSANGLTTKLSGIDNLKITLWTVPEPTSATLLCGFFGLLAAIRRPKI